MVKIVPILLVLLGSSAAIAENSDFDINFGSSLAIKYLQIYNKDLALQRQEEIAEAVAITEELAADQGLEITAIEIQTEGVGRGGYIVWIDTTTKICRLDNDGERESRWGDILNPFPKADHLDCANKLSKSDS